MKKNDLTDANCNWELAKLEWTLKCRNAETILGLNGFKICNERVLNATNEDYTITFY